MNFQLKLYQLIKPRLRDQKYEISSGSSLLSFESDWYSGKQPVARCCCSFPLGQPLLCSRHFHSTARQGLADWSPQLFIWGIGSSWGTSNNPGVGALLTEQKAEEIQGDPILLQPNMENTPIRGWIFLCQTFLCFLPLSISLRASGTPPKESSSSFFLFNCTSGKHNLVQVEKKKSLESSLYHFSGLGLSVRCLELLQNCNVQIVHCSWLHLCLLQGLESIRATLLPTPGSISTASIFR